VLRQRRGRRVQAAEGIIDPKPHLRTLEEIERECIPGLVQVLREENLEVVRYFPWNLPDTP
jgi:hypothetical protein